MASTSTNSTARLEARVSQEVKALLIQAANLEGRSLTDFIVAAVCEQARRVIAQHQVIELSAADSEAFVDALLNPPEPNESLRAAALRYKDVISH